MKQHIDGTLIIMCPAVFMNGHSAGLDWSEGYLVNYTVFSALHLALSVMKGCISLR